MVGQTFLRAELVEALSAFVFAPVGQTFFSAFLFLSSVGQTFLSAFVFASFVFCLSRFWLLAPDFS